MSQKNGSVILSVEKLEAILGVVGDMIQDKRISPREMPKVIMELVKRHASAPYTRAERQGPKPPLEERMAKWDPELSSDEINEIIAELFTAREARKKSLPTEPCMPPEEAISYERIVCLIDGVPRARLYRYLMTHYGMTPEDYRKHFGLRDDYPVVSQMLLDNPKARY